MGKKKKKETDSPSGVGTAAGIKAETDEGAQKGRTRFADDAPAPTEAVTVAADDAASKADAAAKIQAIRRGKQGRDKVTEEKKISQMREEREKAATKLQAISKGRAQRAKVTSEIKPSVSNASGPSLGERLAAWFNPLIQPCAKCAANMTSKGNTSKDDKSAAENLPPSIRAKVSVLFSKMDIDGDGKIQEAEAIDFFKKFSKLNARAMLNEV